MLAAKCRLGPGLGYREWNCEFATPSNCLTNRTNARDYTRKRRATINKQSANYITLAVFAPLLVLTGVAGFLVPARLSLTSGAPTYNLFHIFFGAVGLLLVLSRRASLISGFNLVFGLIDLYQALASYLHLAPQQYFLWTPTDDLLHIIIGLILVVIGGVGIAKGEQR